MQTFDLNTGVEHAAILLLSMGEEAAANVLKQLNREQVRQLTMTMASLPALKNDEVSNVYRRFFDDFRAESGISGASRAYLERTLDKALGRSLSEPLLNAIYGDTLKQNLQSLQWLEPSKIAELISGEHPQMQAVFLAYLDPDVASEVLMHLPESSMDDLLYRVANLSEIHPSMVEEVQVLINRFLELPAQQSSTPIDGTDQATAIINRLKPDYSLKVMQGMKEHDPELVGKLESKMYNFSILEQQSEETLERLVQDINQETLAVALKGASQALQDKIFTTMTKRAAQFLQDAIESSGRVRASAVEDARQEIVTLLRQLADSGEIELQLFSE